LNSEVGNLWSLPLYWAPNDLNRRINPNRPSHPDQLNDPYAPFRQSNNPRNYIWPKTAGRAIDVVHQFHFNCEKRSFSGAMLLVVRNRSLLCITFMGRIGYKKKRPTF
jgi:hypothetical protein